MAASLTSLVNQRLACTRMLLADIAVARSPVHERALLDACLFHLCCGYRFYVRELASYYGVKYPDHLQDESDAAKALSQIDKHPAEIQELNHLAELPDSWLTLCRALYAACWEVPSVATPAAESVIVVKNLDQVELPELSAALIEDFSVKFQELVSRHRETSVEC